MGAFRVTGGAGGVREVAQDTAGQVAREPARCCAGAGGPGGPGEVGAGGSELVQPAGDDVRRDRFDQRRVGGIEHVLERSLRRAVAVAHRLHHLDRGDPGCGGDVEERRGVGDLHGFDAVAVGTRLTPRPPHRSEHALLTHSALALDV